MPRILHNIRQEIRYAAHRLRERRLDGDFQRRLDRAARVANGGGPRAQEAAMRRELGMAPGHPELLVFMLPPAQERMVDALERQFGGRRSL